MSTVAILCGLVFVHACIVFINFFCIRVLNVFVLVRSHVSVYAAVYTVSVSCIVFVQLLEDVTCVGKDSV